jgi:hypothetical protein
MLRKAAILMLLLLAVCGLGLAFRNLLAWRSSRGSDASNSEWLLGDPSRNLSLLAASLPEGSVPVIRRTVYRYSVVPGGVHDPAELKYISDHDPVVKDHFEDFDYRHARIVEVDRPTPVYLSYRLGGEVFWTKKPVILQKGEKLITDGKITARTRCANRVSKEANKAVSPEEPPAEEFERPMIADGTAMQVPFPEQFLSALNPPPLPPVGSPGPPGQLPPGTGFWPGGLPPIFPPSVPVCNPKNGPCPKNPKPPPPPPVPEPATLVLLTSGLAGIYWWRHSSKLRKSI